MLNVAFKEWAAVCRALADGRQVVILRKGGIAEADGEFRPERPRFWLYPTFFHAQEAALVPEAGPLVAAAFADKPLAGRLRLTHFAEVTAVRHMDTLDAAFALEGLHAWSADTVRQRFHYRSPGIYALTVRVYRVETPADVPEHPAYAGCKTWVDLDPGVEEHPATPVLSGEAFAFLAAVVQQRSLPV